MEFVVFLICASALLAGYTKNLSNVDCNCGLIGV
jgi:hypothetical protein